ncbi:MAG: UPF0147 family protein [Euryarchaeota archaeon]|nr:UPF0147 family protein [Euryarchaeota archaeon]MBU4491018.1 UPF0147 family protein [Euryarchaeota archaeon]
MITVSENPGDVIRRCIDVLDRISTDDSVPRNIRRSADNIKKTLSNEKEPLLVRAAMVISNLDDIGNDPNVPIHTRTLVWGLSSRLESIPMDR